MNAAALCLFLLSQTEPPVAEILRRMDEAAAKARGLAFELVNAKGETGARGRVARDGTVRLDEGWKYGGSWVAAPEALFVLVPERGTRERIAFGSPCASDPVESSLEGCYLRALAPGRMLSLEPGLRVQGRASEGDEECFVLASKAAWPGAFEEGVCVRPEGYKAEARRYFVGTRTYRLRRVETRSLKGDTFQAYFWVALLQDWRDDGVPRLVKMAYGRELDEKPTEYEYRASGVRKEPLEGASVRPADDLYATHARHPGIERLLAEKPGDPEIVYSAAVALQEQMEPLFAGGTDVDRAAELLEKLVEKKLWPGPVRALFHLRRGAPEASLPLAKRVAAAGGVADDVAAQAATVLADAGEPDEALRILPARGYEEARIRVHYARKEFDRVFATALDGEMDLDGDVYWLFMPLQADEAVSRKPFLAALDRAVAARPDSALLHQVAFIVHGSEGSLPGFAEIAERALAAREKGLVAYRILEGLKHRLVRRAERDLRSPPEAVKAERPRLLRILSALEGDPLAGLLRAAVHRISGDREAAAEQYARVIARMDGVDPGPAFREIVPALIVELDEFGDADLFDRGTRAATDRGRAVGASVSDLGPALPLLIRRRGKSPGKLFHDLKHLGASAYGTTLSNVSEVKVEELTAAAQGILEEGSRGSARDVIWLARAVEGDLAAGAGVWRVNPRDLWARAVEKDPGGLEALTGLARFCRAKGEPAGARKALEVARARFLEGARPSDARWTLGRLDLLLAEQCLKSGDGAAARAALARVDLSAARPWELWLAAEVLDGVGEAERAIGLLERLVHLGYRPHLRMSEIARKAADPVNWLRGLNRAIAEGYDARLCGPFDAEVSARSELLEAAVLIERRRDGLEKVEPDFFIRRFLESAPVPAPEEEKRARAACANLSEGGPGERDAAMTELRKIGPGAARVLAPSLGSSDGELRARVRELLAEWSEPR